MSGTCPEKRAAPDPWNIGFGVALFGLAAVALLVWFPYDIEGAFVETNYAGKLEPGDAFFPVLLAGTILGLSIFHLVSSLFSRRQPGTEAASAKLTGANIGFLILFHGIVIAGLAVMYWLGPLTTALVNMLEGGDRTYRQLVDTAPYKYIGYGAGAFLMTTGLIGWAERGLRPRVLLTVLAVIVSCVLIFDVLLSNVQLPPNADY